MRAPRGLGVRDRKELSELVLTLEKAPFSHRIKSVRVFGSAARGEMGADSDLDVLVIADSRDTVLFKELIAIAFGIFLKHGRYISLKLFSEEDFAELSRLKTPFISAVSREGRILWSRS